jgi:3-phytase
VFVIDRDGAVEQYRLEPGETLHAKRVRSFRVGSQAEGIVADRETANVS